MTQKLIVLIGLIVICVACSNEKETPSGLKFKVVREGDGIKPDSGKHLVLNLLYKDGNDSIWNDTRKNNLPTIIQVHKPIPSKDGVIQAIMMMSKGDSITFKISAKELFENTFRSNIPYGIDSASLFTFNVGLKDVLTQEQLQKLQSDIVAKQNEEYVKYQEKQMIIDADIIDKYLSEKGITAEKTESGLRYIVTKPGKGENAKPGQSATVTYSGYLLNGTAFDSGTYTFVVDTQEVIKGWDVAGQLMNKGSKLTVYIPSPLAYGSQKRSEVIVENSILVFDMEMVDIK